MLVNCHDRKHIQHDPARHMIVEKGHLESIHSLSFFLLGVGMASGDLRI